MSRLTSANLPHLFRLKLYLQPAILVPGEAILCVNRRHQRSLLSLSCSFSSTVSLSEEEGTKPGCPRDCALVAVHVAILRVAKHPDIPKTNPVIRITRRSI